MPRKPGRWLAAALLGCAFTCAATAQDNEGFPYVIPPLHVQTPNGPVTRTPVKLPEPPADRSASCDAACLTSIATQYLLAMARRDYNSLPVAGNLLVSENGHPTRLGDDTWRVLEQMNLPATYFTDPVQGQVVALTTIEESAHQPLIYIVRLKVENRRIADVEQIVIQDIDSGQHFRPDHITNFDPDTMAVLPEDERMTRAELLAASDDYWWEEGKGLADGGCTHWENGDKLSEFHCSLGRNHGEAGPAYGTRALRNVIVDPTRGLVITFGYEDMTPYLNPEPPDAERTPIFYRQPRTNVIMEIHKYRKGNQLIAQQIFMDFQEAGLLALFPRVEN